jgi:hypothetical protein
MQLFRGFVLIVVASVWALFWLDASMFAFDAAHFSSTAGIVFFLLAWVGVPPLGFGVLLLYDNF